MFYPLRDMPSKEDLKRLGLREEDVIMDVVKVRRGVSIMAIKTGQKRPPRAGEWFLSGAVPEAYKASNDLASEYQILRLVKAWKRVVTEVGIEN